MNKNGDESPHSTRAYNEDIDMDSTILTLKVSSWNDETIMGACSTRLN